MATSPDELEILELDCNEQVVVPMVASILILKESLKLPKYQK